MTDPRGGFNLWVKLPFGVDSLALFQAYLAENIGIASSTMFSVAVRYRHSTRLEVAGQCDDAGQPTAACRGVSRD